MKKKKFLMFLGKNDIDFFNECGFLENDDNCLCLEFENILMEQYEDYLDYIKKEEKSISEMTSI